jgi:hypothetical protein
MRPSRSDATEAPFSLVCRECDAGMDMRSSDQSLAAGWCEIDYTPELPMANFAGLCPDCRESFEHWPTAENGNES